MSFQERQLVKIGLASVMAVVGLSAIAIVAFGVAHAAPGFADKLFTGNTVAMGWLGAVWFAFNALFVVPLFGSTVKQFLRETPGEEQSRFVLNSLR